jgi:hypothetical protein
VSWYLPAELADAHTELRWRAQQAAAQVPRGTLARVAIDAWTRHSPDRAAVAAVDYAAEAHDQPYRTRRKERAADRPARATRGRAMTDLGYQKLTS